MSACSLRPLFPEIRLEAKEMIPPARPFPEVSPAADDDVAVVDEGDEDGAGWLGRLEVSPVLIALLLRSLLSVSSLFLMASLLLLANLSSDLVSSLGDMQLYLSGDGLRPALSDYLLDETAPSSLLLIRILFASSTDLARFLITSASL